MAESQEQPVVFSHVLVPKHEVTPESELQELFQKFKITKQNLPWLKSTDPAVIALGAKVGDVVKVLRTSPVTGKETAYYRLVVE